MLAEQTCPEFPTHLRDEIARILRRASHSTHPEFADKYRGLLSAAQQNAKQETENLSG